MLGAHLVPPYFRNIKASVSSSAIQASSNAMAAARNHFRGRGGGSCQAGLSATAGSLRARPPAGLRGGLLRSARLLMIVVPRALGSANE